MEIKKASRKKTKLKLGISAPSGFGKTYSALLLGKGLVGSYDKICVIDTENESASLYSDLGDYSILPLNAPYSPERYIQAIDAAINAGFKLIIIDSITHEWNGKGGCLEIVESLGGKYQDWAKVTPRHTAFIEKIIQSNVHIITTVRNKQDYEMTKDSSGKLKVEKVGMKQETRDGFEYELTVSLDIINDKHLVKAGKDRTGLFMNKPEFVITEETGKQILDWCEKGEGIYKLQGLKDKIAASTKKGEALLAAVQTMKKGLDTNYPDCADYTECNDYLSKIADRLIAEIEIEKVELDSKTQDIGDSQ